MNEPFFSDQEVIILTKNGIWLADGIEISHEPTRKLFARSLKKKGSEYFLEIGREKKKITIEDTPYFVIRIDGSPKEGFQLSLNDETKEKLNPQTLDYRPGRLVCSVKNQTEEAKFLHAPYFELLKEIEEDENGYSLQIQGERIRLAEKTH